MAFIIVLAVSAYWDRTIVLLHVLEAIPYLAAAVFCLRQHPFGYALGVASGAFWLHVAGTQTTFVRNGFERVAMLLTTGQVDRWDVFIAAPATLSAGGLVVFSLWAYLHGPKRLTRDVVVFAAVALLVIGFFSAAFAVAGPRYLPLVRRAFGL
jgi:hypothetical protein